MRVAWTAPWVLLLLSLAAVTDAQPKMLISPRRGGGGGKPPLLKTTTKAPLSVPATHYVSFPYRVRPGTTLPVSVHLVNKGAMSNVTVTLHNETSAISHAPTRMVTGDGNSSIFDLEIPQSLDKASWRRKFAVHVVGQGDVNFNYTKKVQLNRKSLSVFVQTDKAIYKPGQTVKLRALAMGPDLKVVHEPMSITIRDPQNNLIRQWKNVTGVNDTGVVEKTLPTSRVPLEGEWEIEVTVRGQEEKKAFFIEEYVLPKFEAEVDVPKIILLSEANYIQGTAKAKYTFGKPLTDAKVLVTLKMTYFYDRYHNMTQPIHIKYGVLDKNGEFSFNFTESELVQLYQENHPRWKGKVDLKYKTFHVLVNVTDVRTGARMGADSKVQFSPKRAKIQFLSITPSSYKPGLKYTAHVKVQRPDNKLFENYQTINVTFNVTFSVLKPTTTTTTTTTTTPKPNANLTLVKSEHPHHGYWNVEKTVHLTTVNKTLTPTGFLSIAVDIPSHARSVTISVTVLEQTTMKFAVRSVSQGGNYLQVQAQTDKPQVGQVARFTMKTTEPVQTVTYQLYSKGLMLAESRVVALDPKQHMFNVSFNVKPIMAPTCRFLAFYFRSSGEVVADSMSFKVLPAPDSAVQLSYNKETVKPGEDVELTVTARPSSFVFLLGIDKSVDLMKSGNDITQEMVEKELVKYDYDGGFIGIWFYMRICGWPMPSHSLDAHGVFQDAMVAFFTDGNVYQKKEENAGQMNGVYMAKAPARRQSGGDVESQADQATMEEETEDGIRKFFPETWLFSTVFVGKKGYTVIRKTAPDTITTWLTSAFAVHPQLGLSVVHEPTELTTFKKVFVSLDLPYSAIRGEDLCLKAFAFNYHNEPLFMRLVMGRNEDVSMIRLVRVSRTSKNRVEYRAPMRTSHRIGKVQPNAIGETSFCFTPNALGYLPISVNLTTVKIPGLGDGVERMLLVEPEGVPRMQTYPVTIDVDKDAEFQHVVPISFPHNAVSGSERITVAVAGDLLGPVFENIDDLLRMPYGCGEQNMLYFAPNVFLIDYLQKTNTYTEELAAKAEKYMLVGYQKEIHYKHKDGSYSAFGERRNASGSMWLTAFVTKCFVQSMDLGGGLVNVEPSLVRDSLRWMVSFQGPDGSFAEPGKVFNKNMQGGSAKGEALTAYVLIALAEADANFADMMPKEKELLQGSILKARVYLEQQLPSLNDSYDLAIVTYALHLTNSEQADEAFSKLMGKGISESLTLHWERPKPAKQPSYYYWQRRTDAINIEMTAYVLLIFNRMNDLDGALPIVRWLTSQRGPQGGFISTQDTVISLQALSQIATKIYQPKYTPIEIKVDWSVNGQPESRTVMLNDTTKLLLQKVVVPVETFSKPADITIRAKMLTSVNFTGIAVAEVTLDYNVLEATNFTTYSLVPDVRVENADNFVLTLKASRMDQKTGSMTVIEVGVPTGYDVDKENPAFDVSGSSMAEPSDRKFILYYDELGEEPISASLPMMVTNGIPVNTQPTPVRIYDYYENGGDQQMTVNYELPKVDFICERNPNYEVCPYIKLL